MADHQNNPGGSYDASYAQYMDHTVLKPATTKETVEKFCDEAIAYGFASVCINPTHVKLVSEKLTGTGVKTCCVIGFPLGANTTNIKKLETLEAVENGAQEVDMVINIGALKDQNYGLVYEDIKAVVNAAPSPGAGEGDHRNERAGETGKSQSLPAGKRGRRGFCKNVNRVRIWRRYGRRYPTDERDRRGYGDGQGLYGN